MVVRIRFGTGGGVGLGRGRRRGVFSGPVSVPKFRCFVSFGLL
jgi:hypothetical protein